MRSQEVTITIEREPGEAETYSVEDNGGEFDRDEGLGRWDAQDEAQVRREHYEQLGCTVEVRA